MPNPIVVSSFDPNPKPTRLAPTYLVLIDETTQKVKSQKFIATRIDESNAVVKMIGIDTEATIGDISERFQDILNATDKKLYKEITVPWCRIIRIQNLIFRQK